MASKECNVYVVDVGQSTGRARNGRDETDLDWSLRYIWDKIATAVATGRKTLHSGLIAFRTNETNNEIMPSEEAYEHISIIHSPSQILLSDMRRLRAQLRPSNTDDGDIISAIVTAMTMIERHCKHLKYTKRIIVLTNGTSFLDADDLNVIAKKILDDNIELTILGADFDDPVYGLKEEDKDETKAKNEAILKDFCENCGGLFGTLAQAVSEMEIPQIKAVRPIHSYRGYLSLGDSANYGTAIQIDIERYPRTTPLPAPTASSFVVKSESTTNGDVAANDPNGDIVMRDDTNVQNGDGLVPVSNARTYQVKDEDAPGGKQDVERDELSRGFDYGATVVPVSESDQLVLNMETRAAYEIVGFIPIESHPHYMNMSKTFYIVPQRTNEKAIMAFSSLVHALYEWDSHAVARVVLKDGKAPTLVILSFEISRDFECLYENELPFHEDVRSYKFPPLDRIVTISGKTLTVHRNLPDEDLQQAMDGLVDAMDLSTYDKDEEGNPAEYISMEDTYSPIYHRIQQVIRHRAINPDSPVPPPYETILKPMKPPHELLEAVQPYLERVQAAADVKKVPPKSFSRRRRQVEPPRSGLDVAALLSNRAQARNHRIDPHNAIPEFKQILDTTWSDEVVHSAIKQLGDIIADWIRHSFGEINYDKAIEAIGVLRQECIELEFPNPYNTWQVSFKKNLLAGDLGGDRDEMWRRVKKAKLGLIDKRTSGASIVNEEEAAEVS